MNETNFDQKLHSFDLTSFSRAHDGMIGTSDNAYGSRTGTSIQFRSRLKDYTFEEVAKILESGTVDE